MEYLARDKNLKKFGEYINVKKDDPLKGIDDWKGWIASDFFFDKPTNIGFITSADAQTWICNNENICILGGSKEISLKLSSGAEQGIFKLSFGEYVKLKKATKYSVVADDNKLTFCYLIIPENAVIEKK